MARLVGAQLAQRGETLRGVGFFSEVCVGAAWLGSAELGAASVGQVASGAAFVLSV
jgi:hypothetical protein